MSPRDTYRQTLTVLRNKRQQLAEEADELDTAITAMERLAQREASPRSRDEEPVHEELPEHPQPTGLYSAMEFIPAAEDFLRRVGIPQSTQEIADGLVAKGFRTRSKDFKNTAQAMLARGLAAGRPFRRIGRSTWGIEQGDANPSSAA